MPSKRRVASIFCYVLSGLFFSTTCVMAFMWTPGELAKWLVVSFGLLPASVFLSIGRALSPERRWTREVGIVLVAAAASGAFCVLTMALMFMDPEFLKSLPPERIPPGFDYMTGILWIALMGGLGGLSLFVARKQR